jgi:hypothetical protein
MSRRGIPESMLAELKRRRIPGTEHAPPADLANREVICQA